MFCNHHSSANSCRVYENKARWLQIAMSKLLPEIAFLSTAEISSWIINEHAKTYRGPLGEGGDQRG
jgi:hypothetical protein